MHSLRCLLMLVWLIGLSNLLSSQNVSITYVNPPDFTVCDTAQFEVTIANTLQDTLFTTSLTAEMPMGMTYVVGSVENATEGNISTVNVPEFNVADLPPGESVTIIFRALSQCSLVDDINNGALFANSYTVAHSLGTTTIPTTPFVIETALLQKVSLNDEVMNGVTGQILTRTWTLTNTRLGALSNLTFTDLYGDGIFITSPMGNVITQAQGILEIELTGADFMNFGDGDGLFELNEQITITEEIEITGCGEPPLSTSFLSASWGCNNQGCQVVEATATVVIGFNGDTPNVISEIINPVPLDYCASQSTPQGIMLTNIGNAPAVDLEVYISHLMSGTMGLQNGSLTILNGDVPVDAQVNFFNQLNFDACATPAGLSDSVAMVIPELLPGDTIFIEWAAFVCAVGCDAEQPSWRYDWYHEFNCPPGAFQSGGEVSGPFESDILVSQFVTYSIGQLLVDQGVYALTYTLKSPLIVDSTGILQIDFELPCGLGWGNNDDFMLDGNSPDSVSVLPSQSGTNVSLFFELPFTVDTVAADFNVVFECDSNCFDIPDCIVEFITSCPTPPATGVIDNIPVFVTSTVLLNEAECGPESCEDFDLTYFCESSTDEICPDTIIGYFRDVQQEFQRVNLGLPDNDSNRRPDPGGSLDMNLIRRDRAIAGDTVNTKVTATMNIDGPPISLPSAALVINFESHLIDDGLGGGQFMDTVNHLDLVANGTGFQNIGGTITIIDSSTGDFFQCDLPTPTFNNEQRGQISIVNTRPEEILDVWFYVQYIYDITPEFLLSQGCDVPPGWEFEQGDVIEADVFHKTIFNSTPPVVINMRTVSGVFAANPPGPLQEDFFICEANAQPWQLGGYQYSVSPGLYQMPPCMSSNEPGNTFIEFSLAMADFFPFEFRSFMHLDNWDYVLPNNVTLLDSRVVDLAIQGGPSILGDTPLSWTQSGQTYDFDISDLPIETLDEGFRLLFNHEFEMPCFVDEPQPLIINATLDFQTCLPEDEDPLNGVFTGATTLFPLRPNIELNPVNVNHESTSNQAVWEFDLSNFNGFGETALNAWLTVYSPSGLVTDFQLINTTTGQTIPLDNGIFQLGDLPAGWFNSFQLVASITSCQPDLVEVNFGWNCEPYDDLTTAACHETGEILTLTALLGEIEMAVQSPQDEFQLCDTVEYHTIEIFNAQFGAVFDLELRAILPEGLMILSGSSEMEYPTGSGFQPIADPDLINGDTALYDLSALNSTIADQGLQGFDNAPNHSVSIRFLAVTECGFINPSQIIFNASGKQGCGLEANELSKPGDELLLEGVPELYNANITIGTNVPPTLSCGDQIDVNITLEADAVTAGTDSVFIYIPPGLSYQPGSYVPGQNASSNLPIIDFINNQFVLKWPLEPGIQPFNTISFDATFAAVAGGQCDSSILEIATFQLQEAECVTTGIPCAILAETGRKDLEVVFTIPSLGLDDLDFWIVDGEMFYTLQLENNGNATSDSILVEFYRDNDNSGTLTPGDTQIEEIVHMGGMMAGEVVGLSGSIPAFYSIICNLIAVVTDEANCTCTEDVETGPDLIEATNQPDSTCLGNIVPVGYPLLPNSDQHTYLWSPSDGLSCTDCSETELNTTELNLSSFPATVTLTFTDVFPNGCTLESQFPVLIVGGGMDPDSTTLFHCPGEVIFLEGPDNANAYDWSGPGIIDSSLQIQSFVLDDTASVSLIWADNFDCPNLIDYTINVPEASITDTIALCEGDSITIDTVTYFDEVENCDTIFENGCAVVRCQFYEPRDTPDVINPLDTLCFLEGTEITIDQLDGSYLTYEWSPDGLLSCDTCPAPTLNIVTQNFLVTVGNGNECFSRAEIAVISIPPCSEESIELPNVFTPNNDGTNDRFGPVLMPGVEKLITQAKLRVWDRWGNKVYEGNGLSAAYWDGLYKNKPSASDVYLYMLELACDEVQVTVKGDVTLLR